MAKRKTPVRKKAVRPHPRQPQWYVAEWLKFLGKKQAWLANEIGTSKGQMSALINGDRRYNADWLNKIAKALGRTPGDILDINPLETAPPELPKQTWKRIPDSRRGHALQVLETFAEGETEKAAPEKPKPRRK